MGSSIADHARKELSEGGLETRVVTAGAEIPFGNYLQNIYGMHKQHRSPQVSNFSARHAARLSRSNQQASCFARDSRFCCTLLKWLLFLTMGLIHRWLTSAQQQ